MSSSGWPFEVSRLSLFYRRKGGLEKLGDFPTRRWARDQNPSLANLGNPHSATGPYQSLSHSHASFRLSARLLLNDFVFHYWWFFKKIARNTLGRERHSQPALHIWCWWAVNALTVPSTSQILTGRETQQGVTGSAGHSPGTRQSEPHLRNCLKRREKEKKYVILFKELGGMTKVLTIVQTHLFILLCI